MLDLHVFDRAWRLLVMDALERVEVAVRAALTDQMSTTYDDPHWYMNAEHFGHLGKHAGLLRIVRDTCDERLRGTPNTGEDSLVHRSALFAALVQARDRIWRIECCGRAGTAADWSVSRVSWAKVGKPTS